jgi:hypothetical protein
VGVEVTFYRTPAKGTRMVMCPCRIKVRVLQDGSLARHWAYDESYRDPASYDGERCVFQGWVLEERTGEVFGMEFGVLSDPGAPETTAV